MAKDACTPCINPCTGEVLGQSPLCAAPDVERAVTKARAAQPAWAAVKPAERARIMRGVLKHIVENADEIARVISRDNGKTRADAMITEVFSAALGADHYTRKAPKWLAEKRLLPGNLLLANKAAKIVKVPYGVVGIISPWNYPFAIPFAEVVMGLLAGNAVILKAASETQWVGRTLEECVKSVGLPEDIFTYINIPGSIAGDAFLAAGVNKLFFTGSVPVGKDLMRKAADTLTPVCLELGGNDAMLVCPDADLDRAVAGAVWAGMQNCGQSCGGVERIYVHESVYDAFLTKLSDRVRGLRVGYDTDFSCDLGSMTTKKQKDAVMRQVGDALAKGAVIHAQSACPKDAVGHFLPAMVLTNVDHTMEVMRDETFGPVVGVMKVKSMDEAVRLANDSNLGLTSSVWSKDRVNAFRLARRIEAGVVMVNDHLMSHGLAETPWGGFKESGIGRTHGEMGFSEMTQPQCIVDELFPFIRKDMWWYPHDESVYRGVKGFLEMLYSPKATARLEGAARMAKTFVRSFRV